MNANPKKPTPRWRTFTYGAIVGLLLAGGVAYALSQGLRSPFGSDDSSSDPDFPDSGPAEFLYLDDARARSYLAQVEGGTFDKQTLTRKLTKTLSGELAIPNAAKGTAGSSEENSVQREVTPTDASIFFALRAALEGANVQIGSDVERPGLQEVSLGNFAKQFRNSRIEEGQFISFQTDQLVPPIYLNPYLVVKQAVTLATIFPSSKPRASERREAAKRFAKRVGRNPRVVFALSDTNALSDSPRYLLPMRYLPLTNERSLIKYGGGDFYVVGKVVRIFSANKRGKNPAYIDSATRETWAQALQEAPKALLYRTTKNRRSDCRVKRKGKIKQLPLRACLLRLLKIETAIPDRGAVILPVAIYK